MKQIIICLSFIFSLTLFSFIGSQEGKLVRLKNGSYVVNKVNLKPETMKELAEYKGWKQAKQLKSFEEFDMGKYTDPKGFKTMMVYANSSEALAFYKETVSNVFSETLYSSDNVRLENEKEAIRFVDQLIQEYLK